MFALLSFFGVLAASAYAMPLDLATCAFPNGTDTALNMYSCATGGDTIDVKSVRITDTDGNLYYPVDPKKPFILELVAFNNGVQYNDNHVAVKIYELKSGWSSTACAWTELPTFGLLDSIDGCDFAKNCPLTVGDLTLKIQLDLSVFSSIISLLSSNTPIELHIEMKNANPGSAGERISCVVAQIKIV